MVYQIMTKVIFRTKIG